MSGRTSRASFSCVGFDPNIPVSSLNSCDVAKVCVFDMSCEILNVSGDLSAPVPIARYLGHFT